MATTIDGREIKNKSLSSIELTDTGVVPGIYNGLTIDSAGRITGATLVGGLNRQTSSIATPSLVYGGYCYVSLPCAKSATLISISTDNPALVRGYTSTTTRNNDIRGLNDPPVAGKGLVFQIRTLDSTNSLSIDFSPQPTFSNKESPTPATTIPLYVMNLSNITTTITINLSYLTLQT